MIVSFGDRTTEALYHGETGRHTRALPADIHRTALRKLDMLDAATGRIVFRWTPNGPTEVRVIDYHA